MPRTSPSLANEALAAVELGALLASPMYYGAGVPRGDGRLALVVPALFANDWYLYPLRSWLQRAGFRPVRSTLPVNAGCPERLTRQIEVELDRRRRDGEPVMLIGHSRGGILARAMVARLQSDASHLILLGSPVGAILRTPEWPAELADAPVTSPIAESSRRARRVLDPDCDVPYCGCPFPADMRMPLHSRTEVISIYSRNDPVVPPSACALPGAANIEVGGTHAGLAFNVEVYRALADALSRVGSSVS